jgi:hypothetical protein
MGHLGLNIHHTTILVQVAVVDGVPMAAMQLTITTQVALVEKPST